MSATVTVKLNPNARRMAQSMHRLFNTIARRDAKAIASVRPAAIIFPPEDAALQAAIAVVITQLETVLLLS